jgi:hypothetical protein
MEQHTETPRIEDNLLAIGRLIAEWIKTSLFSGSRS